MKLKNERRIYRVANSLLITAIVLVCLSLYWHYQPQIDEVYSILALALAAIHGVAYTVLKEIGMLIEELGNKPKSDKGEGWLRPYPEQKPNITPKVRQPHYTEVEIPGSIGKNAGLAKEGK